MSLRAVTGCAVAACLVIAVAPCSARAGEVVSLRVGCVLASNTGQEFDQRLVDLQGRLHRLFRYTSYALVKEQSEKVAMGGKLVFNVPGGRYLMILPKEYSSDGTVLMKVVLLEGARPIINTAVSLKKHATFLVGGPQNNDGALILSISADEVTEDGK